MLSVKDQFSKLVANLKTAPSESANDEIEPFVRGLEPDGNSAPAAGLAGFLSAAKEKMGSAKEKFVSAKNMASEATTSKADSVLRMVTGEPGPEENLTAWEEFNKEMTLTYKQRLMGFGVTLGLGIFFSVLSTMFISLIVLKPHKFAICFTVGNICLLSSTFFLRGPANQFKSMMKDNRYVASLIYGGALVGTLVAAFMHLTLFVLLCIVVQFVALVWYALSYIPFGHTMALKFVNKIMSK